MQFYTRLYEYIYEYQKLIYDYYSKTATAFLTTYYHLNLDNTIWDSTKLTGGYYEKIGELSGVQWDKILLLPVFFIDDLATTIEANEIGFTRERETSIVIPSTYGLGPFPNDIIKLDSKYLQPTNDTFPLFVVTQIERTSPYSRVFYRLKVSVEQSRSTIELEPQVANVYSFFDYTKRIYSVPDTIFLSEMMIKNERLKVHLKHLFDDNSGFYFI